MGDYREESGIWLLCNLAALTTRFYVSWCYTNLNTIAANNSEAPVQLHKYQTALDLREVLRVPRRQSTQMRKGCGRTKVC